MRCVISAVVAALFAGCLASAAEARILTYCAAAEPEGFDPALYVTGTTFDASSQTFYNRLVEFAPGSTAIVPGLATSWDISDDGRQYTFHLREGVKFHSTAYFTPSRDFNADDVVFSLDRQSNPKNPYYAYAGGSWPYYGALGLDKLIKSVKKVNATTVQIVLARPDAGVLADLAMDFASILSKEYADSLAKAKTPELLNAKPVGTGPFQFVRYAPGAPLIMATNLDYWGGPSKVSTLEFLAVPDAAERLAKLKSGDCDVIAQPDAATLTAAKADPDIAVATAERVDVAFLAFNTSAPAFKDPRVRKALGMAIDRQAIVDSIYGGAAMPASAIVPKTMWGYDDSVARDGYDIEAAKQLLTEAGVSDLKVKLLATRTPRPYSPNLAATAAMIANDLAKVGVDARVVAPDRLSDYLRQSADKTRDSAVLIGWTSENGDPDSFLSLLLSCDAVGASNRAEWCDPVFTNLISKAREATDPAERAKLYSEAQQTIAEQSPLTPIVHTLAEVPMRKDVTGYVADPLGRHNFATADISG